MYCIHYDPAGDGSELCLIETPGGRLQQPDFEPEETPTAWVYEHQRPLVIPCLESEVRFPRVAALRNEIIPHMDTHLVTTTFTLDGYRVTRNLGLVRGIVVRSRSIFGTIGASLQTIVGGNITLLAELCEKTREQAFEKMMQHAEAEGANAVIGVRYDATEVMQGATEVLCYGTAVVVERAS